MMSKDEELPKGDFMKYYISGVDVDKQLRHIDCTPDADAMIKLLEEQNKMKTFIFEEVGIDLVLPIMIVIRNESPIIAVPEKQKIIA